ncbi:MAG: hypothetical protein ABJA76_05495 [Mucilaginibacter sp.]
MGAFLFRAQPVSMVYGGPMLWEMDDACRPKAATSNDHACIL